jgi:hypothetical protein
MPRIPTVAYGRYVRTRDGRKRRLTLHHVNSQRRARGFYEAGSAATTAWLEYMHSAWAGMSAVGPRAHTPCVLRRRNERINAMLEEWEK